MACGVTIDFGGAEIVQLGGTAVSIELIHGAAMTIDSGRRVLDVQVDSGVTLALGSDADAGDIVLSSGVTLGVPADGNAGGVQVSNGATVAAIGPGFVTDDSVFAGAVATLFGGYAFSTSLGGGTEGVFAVLAAVRARVLPIIEQHGPIRALIIDDTAMPKKGGRSVGVARQ